MRRFDWRKVKKFSLKKKMEEKLRTAIPLILDKIQIRTVGTY